MITNIFCIMWELHSIFPLQVVIVHEQKFSENSKLYPYFLNSFLFLIINLEGKTHSHLGYIARCLSFYQLCNFLMKHVVNINMGNSELFPGTLPPKRISASFSRLIYLSFTKDLTLKYLRFPFLRGHWKAKE